MKNTRYYDMQKIEEDMAKGLISRKRGKDLLENLYKQSKDGELEGRRERMIERQAKLSRFNRTLRRNPAKFSQSEQERAVKYFIANPEEF